jgi:PKD repeat protein
MVGRARVLAGIVLALTLGPACDDEQVTDSTDPLTIRCSATPTAGPAPLTVAFGLDVANAIGTIAVQISYGDGQTGTDASARHVYGSAGDYMASLTVSAGIESARCSVPIAVAAAVAPSPSPSPSPTVPNPPGNQGPVASFKTNPEGTALTGKAPFTVQFNLCRTVDPDGDKLLFRMDLDGDGVFEFLGSSGADCRHEKVYSAGVVTATQCVTDVNCPSWPLCNDYAPLHPYQCRSYTVTAVP